MTTQEEVRYDVSDRIAEISLARPPVNALSLALLEQLIADRPSSTRGVDRLVQPSKLMHRDRVEADSVSGRCQLVCKGSEHLVLPLAVLALSHSLTDTEVGVVR